MYPKFGNTTIKQPYFKMDVDFAFAKLWLFLGSDV